MSFPSSRKTNSVKATKKL